MKFEASPAAPEKAPRVSWFRTKAARITGIIIGVAIVVCSAAWAFVRWAEEILTSAGLAIGLATQLFIGVMFLAFVGLWVFFPVFVFTYLRRLVRCAEDIRKTVCIVKAQEGTPKGD